MRILIGIVRLKVIALLLGPAGVGLFGLFQNLQSTTASVVGVGLNFGSIRLLVLSKVEKSSFESIRLALFTGNLLMGFLAIPFVFFFRHWLADLVFQDPSRAWECGLIGVGVLFTLLAGSQAAVLQAFGAIKPLAWLGVIEIALVTAIGTVLLLRWEFSAIIALVLMAPALNFFIACVLVARNVGKPSPSSWASVPKIWRKAISLSFAHMAGVSVSLMTLTFVLAITGLYRGASDVGYLHAVLSISALTSGFLMQAMQVDYYPKLIKAGARASQVNDLVNAQSRLALLVIGPVLVGLACTVEWVIPLLFSDAFAPAIPLLGWWLLSDVLLVLAWVIGFLMVLYQDNRAYFSTQLFSNLAFGIVAFAMICSDQGLASLAIGKIIMSGLLFGLSTYIAYTRYNFHWSREVIFIAMMILLSVSILRVFVPIYPNLARLIGMIVTVGAGYFSVREVSMALATD